MNRRPMAYEAIELPDCSTSHQCRFPGIGPIYRSRYAAFSSRWGEGRRYLPFGLIIVYNDFTDKNDFFILSCNLLNTHPGYVALDNQDY